MNRQQFNRGVPVWRPSLASVMIGLLSWVLIIGALVLAFRIGR